MERGQFFGIETRAPDVENPKEWFIVRHRGMSPGGNGLDLKRMVKAILHSIFTHLQGRLCFCLV